uniref:DNA replication complex GINS protein PSF3 n=1 Tax=Panagrellus redivivus TaxID=6233 RepID=A0A7E4UZL1_PANRE
MSPEGFVIVEEDYYNLDDIMATRATIACTFSQKTPSEFFPLIGQRAPDAITEKGFKTEAPSWMICALNGQEVECDLHIPRAFTETIRNGLLAEPELVNLSELCSYFYLYGIRISNLINGTNGHDLAECLLLVFMKRSGMIYNKVVDMNFKPRKMDSIEKTIFLAGQKTEKRTTNWFHSIEKQQRKRKSPSNV